MRYNATFELESGPGGLGKPDRLLVEAARLLAFNPNVGLRMQLQSHLQARPMPNRDSDGRMYVRALLKFERCLAQLSGNPPIEMMINVMRDLLRDPRYGYFHVDESRAAVYVDFCQATGQGRGRPQHGDPDRAPLHRRDA